MALGFRVLGLGFSVLGSGVLGLGVRVLGLGLRVLELGCRDQSLEFRALGFGVQSLGGSGFQSLGLGVSRGSGCSRLSTLGHSPSAGPFTTLNPKP